MLKDITEVRHLGGHRLLLRFEDGVQGEVDLASRISFDGVFRPLRDVQYFAKVSVNRDIGTVVWPNGADLDPDVLYSLVKGQALPVAS